MSMMGDKSSAMNSKNASVTLTTVGALIVLLIVLFKAPAVVEITQVETSVARGNTTIEEWEDYIPMLASETEVGDTVVLWLHVFAIKRERIVTLMWTTNITGTTCSDQMYIVIRGELAFPDSSWNAHNDNTWITTKLLRAGVDVLGYAWADTTALEFGVWDFDSLDENCGIYAGQMHYITVDEDEDVEA